MKRKARQVLSLAEELCEIDQIYLEAKRFQLGYSGELVVSDLDGDLAYQNGTTQFVDEGRGDQDEVDPDVDKCENIDEIDLTNHEIAEKEKQMAIGESCNIPQEQDTGLLDMNSNVFDPKYWPADAHSRCHLYLKRTHPDSSNILRDDCLVVYLSVTSHRTEGNPSLSMALWLSESLQIDLDVISFLEKSVYSTALADDDLVEHSAHRKAVTRVSALSSFKARLLEETTLDLHVLVKEREKSLYEVLLCRYSHCMNCSLSNQLKPYSNLIVIADDGLHPYLDNMYRCFEDSFQSPELCERRCDTCFEIIQSVKIQAFLTFDSISVVPIRHLISEYQKESEPDPLTELLTRLHAKFESLPFSTQTLLSPFGPSRNILASWMSHRPRPSTSMRRYRRTNDEVDWTSLTQAFSSFYSKFLIVENNFQNLPCRRSSVLETLHEVIQVSASPTLSPKLANSNFWDIYSCWGVVSPLEIFHQCLHSSKLQLWKSLFRSPMLHMESCRLVFLLKSPSKLANKDSFSIQVQSLLSPKSLQLLQLCSGPPSSSLLRPGSIHQPDTGNEVFDQIHSRLKRHGVIPFGPCGGYWIAFLLLHCPSGESALHFASLEISKYTLSFVEYTSWPITYIASLLESLSTTLITSDSLQHGHQVYDQLERFLSQLRI